MDIQKIIDWHHTRARHLLSLGERENCLFHTEIALTLHTLKKEREALSDQLDKLIEG